MSETPRQADATEETEPALSAIDVEPISDEDLEAAAHTRLHVLIAKHLARRDWSVSDQEIADKVLVGSLADSSLKEKEAHDLKAHVIRIMHELRRVTEADDPPGNDSAGEALLPLTPEEAEEVHASVKETKGGFIGTLRALRAS
jgi:hypothetical protein